MADGMDMGKQVGPLPLGAWVAIVAGGLGIAWYTRNSSANNVVDVPVEDTSGQTGVGGGAGWIAVPPPSTAPTDQPTEFQTNEEWARASIGYLIAQGYDGSEVDTAIRRYLESSPLSLSQRALVTLALTKFKSPPVPLPIPPDLPVIPPTNPPPVTQPPPPPPPPPPRPVFRIHVVTPWNTKGSTLWGIAQIYYGNGERWRDLYNANRKGITRMDGAPGYISNPNYLRPGDRVLVP